ncbi:MAG: adenosylcobinamide-GDP ribazoletransferase [Treponema sp.]|nr:adenosylcobinamide-GDP ribazoletransferase [Treponema sp.]
MVIKRIKSFIKIFFETLNVAFSMFSAIPMHHVDWNEKNMKYMMCAFPFVGLVIGFLWFLWGFVVENSFLSSTSLIPAAVYTIIPVIVTGGIHLDGFCDTCDALASHQSKDKMLEILKDSHCGSFAIIDCVLYFILYLAFATELKELPLSLCFIFVLERALSAIAVALFPCAKNSGLLYVFSSSGVRKSVAAFNIALSFLLWLLLIIFCKKEAFAIIIACLLSFLGYYVLSKKYFGGITGDLAGAFLQLCELCCIIAVVVVNYIL